jgi:hypothetical protein
MVNQVTGQEAVAHYSKDGQRALAGLSDRPLITPYEVRNGRRIETTIVGDQHYAVDDRILGAREDEIGYVNYEIYPLRWQSSRHR